MATAELITLRRPIREDLTVSEDYDRGRELARGMMDEVRDRQARIFGYFLYPMMALVAISLLAAGGFFWYFTAHPEYGMFGPPTLKSNK